jgi:xanthine dehydrogenase accessory factor
MFEHLVVIKGAGDLASGVAFRLVRSGFPVIMTELPQPTVVRRSVAFAQAVFDGHTHVEGIPACLAGSAADARTLSRTGSVAVLVDPETRSLSELRPTVLVDAAIAKRNTGTRRDAAPVVIGLGPGFRAGVDVHAGVETNRGHRLGRGILSGVAEPDTGVPAPVGGYGAERVLRAPADGMFAAARCIGDALTAGDVLGHVNGQAIVAPFDGCLRGLIQTGVAVHTGMKIGDVDPRATREHCFTISDKALAIGGGVLEATLYFLVGKNGSTNTSMSPPHTS